MNQGNQISKLPSGVNGLPPLPHKQAWSLPDAYFHRFPEAMLHIIHCITGDEYQMPPIAPADFQVPDAYFDTFPEAMMVKIKEMETYVTSGQYNWTDSSRKAPFTVPLNYFEQLPQIVLKKIDTLLYVDEEPGLSPALAGLRNKQVFDVPDGYLAKAPAIPEIIPTPKVIAHPAQRSIRWSGWAAAAAVILLFTLGGIKFLPGRSDNGLSTAQQLALVSDDDIENYLIDHIDELNMGMLESSLSMETATDYNNILKNVSDEEIEFYMEAM